MEARNEIGTEVDLSITRVADRLGRVKAHTATVQANAQHLKDRIRPWKAHETNASRYLQNMDDDLISSEDDRDHFKME